MENFCRIDYKIEKIEEIGDGYFRFALVLNPERYEKKNINGVEGYWDKLDEIFITEEALEKMGPDLINSPIHYPSKRIDDIKIYTDKRIKYLRENFESIEGTYEFHDKSRRFLESLKDEKRRFVILSIDIKGSTKMAQEIGEEKNKKIISVFFGEISKIINGFNGYVLKYLGDGLLAYFPEPNYIGMNDNAIDCANSIKYYILNGLNAIFFEKNYPSIDFRMGLDSGEASVMIFGPKDLIGQTISLATKIQGLAHTNKILAGEATIKSAHTHYRKQFKKMTLPKDWEYYKDDSKEKYNIYVSKY